MKQILHIFSKDLRRLRIEILLSVFAAALFVWEIPKNWVSAPGAVGNHHQTSSDLVSALVFLSWGLLIAQLIHGEVLVGDRQFWITRPYEWPKLLAAKTLFVALLVYLPYLLIQIAILLQTGFNPLSYIPGLLYRLLLISLVFFPLIGVAAVTSNLARMVVTIVLSYVALIALSSLAFVSHLAGLPRGSDGPIRYQYLPYGEVAAVVVTLLFCGAAVVLLYARRRVMVARLLLGSTPVLLLLAYSIGIRSESMEHAYPPAVETDPSLIRMIPFEQDEVSRVAAHGWSSSGHGYTYNLDTQKWAIIKVMVRASAVAAQDRWQLNAFRPTLLPAHGAPLELDWQQEQETFQATDAPKQLNYFVLAFLIPRSAYDRLTSSTLALHLDFALTQGKPERSWRLSLPAGNFSIPDLASCSSHSEGQRDTLQVTGLTCNFPLRVPMMSLTTFPTKGPCPAAPAPAGDPAAANSSTVGDFNVAPATVGISPMEEGWFMSFATYNSDNGTPTLNSQPTRVCPGTPVYVTKYRKARAVQTGVTIENFKLAD